MLAHLVFVDDRVLRAGVALGAFAGGAHELGAGLLGFDRGPGAIDEEGRQDQGEGNDDGEENRAKRHLPPQ